LVVVAASAVTCIVEIAAVEITAVEITAVEITAVEIVLVAALLAVVVDAAFFAIEASWPIVAVLHCCTWSQSMMFGTLKLLYNNV